MAKVLTAVELGAIKGTTVADLKVTDLQNLLETLKRVPLQKASGVAGDVVGTEETASAVLLKEILTSLA